MTPRKAVRIEITLAPEKAAALDEARGNEPRASFIKRATDEKVAAVQRRRELEREEDEDDGMTPPPPWRRPSLTLPPLSYTSSSPIGPNVSAKPAAARKPRPKGKR